MHAGLPDLGDDGSRFGVNCGVSFSCKSGEGLSILAFGIYVERGHCPWFKWKPNRSKLFSTLYNDADHRNDILIRIWL